MMQPWSLYLNVTAVVHPFVIPYIDRVGTEVTDSQLHFSHCVFYQGFFTLIFISIVSTKRSKQLKDMDDTTTSEAHMVKYCDVCGDIGVVQAIATCTQCKVSREHLYCMRTLRYDHPENWFCETCEDLMKASSSLNNPDQLHDNSAHPNKLPHDLRRNPIDREKKMHTGKVKLLSTEEVIRLNSRAMLPGFPVKHSFHPHTVLRKNRSIKVRNPTAFGGIPPKSNSHSISPSELEKQFKPLIAQQQVAQSSARQREKDATQPSPKKRMQSWEGHRIMSNIDYAEKMGSEIVVEKATVSSTTISPVKFDQPIVDSGGVISSTTKIPVASLRSFSSLSPAPKVDKYIPASEASWKGSFNLLVCGPKKWEISGVIQAHPPSRVRRKVYKSSKLMPEVLEFELVQRGSLWVNLFGNYTPDNRDIGLYLFPSTCKRCKNYTFLLEHIGEQDMVLRTYRDGLELLVFTSKILQIDSQRWDGMYFLWGLFRRIELTFPSVQAETNHCHDKGDNNNGIDMEIDMIGGQNVGRLDIVVPRIPLQVPLRWHENETYPEIPPGLEQMHHLTGQRSNAASANPAFETFSKIPPGFEKLHHLTGLKSSAPSANPAIETFSNIPPGFEKLHHLTGQRSSAPSANHGNETFSNIPPGFEKLSRKKMGLSSSSKKWTWYLCES